MNYAESIQLLRRRLKEPLPGFAAHAQMLPEGRRINTLKWPQLFAKKSGVALILYPENNQTHSVLIERNIYNGIHSGQISLPGGRKEKNDKDLIATALRETYEEIGLPAASLEIIGVLSELYIPPSNFLVLPVIACTPEKPLFIPDTTEVQNIITYNTEILLDAATVGTKTFKGAFYSIEAPFYNVCGYSVWGATAMILSELQWLLNKNVS